MNWVAIDVGCCGGGGVPCPPYSGKDCGCCCCCVKVMAACEVLVSCSCCVVFGV